MIFSAVWDKFVYCSLRSGQREACTGNPTRYLVCGESNGLCYCTSHQDLLCVSCGAANVWILPWLRYLIFHYTSYISLLTRCPKRIVPSRSSRDSDRAGPSLIRPPRQITPLVKAPRDAVGTTSFSLPEGYAAWFSDFPIPRHSLYLNLITLNGLCLCPLSH